jgi:Protein of unknown function (DUF3103)
MYKKLGTATALALALAAPLAPLASSAASAEPLPPPVPIKGQPVEEIKSDVVKDLVTAIADVQARKVLHDSLIKDGQADLTTVFADLKGSKGADFFNRQVDKADREVKHAKGLAKMQDSALSIRLVNPETKDKLKPGPGATNILLASSSSNDEKGATVTAYDFNGKKYELDVHTPPTVPVALVELDNEKITPIAMEVVSEELAKVGVESEAIKPGPVGDQEETSLKAAPATTKIVTRMDRVKVNNDQEPWISGRAEFYGMALGQGKDGKARVDLVQMPYLDYDDTTYFPNQIIVDWSHYKWNAVDFMFMEHDDNTNYAQIAIVVANAIAPFTGGAEYVALATKVLNALPASWFTNDDDYADSLYFLTRDSQGAKVGAGNNVRVTLSKRIVTSN